MTQDHTPPWMSRRTIPNPQIHDAANQYEAARQLLESEQPGSGILLPLMNTAAIAIELYLKCLSAETVYVQTSTSDVSEGVLVHAASWCKGHKLTALFDAIPDDIQNDLEQSFEVLQGAAADGCRSLFAQYEGVFMKSRYPFEGEACLTKFNLQTLMRVSRLLSEFVADLEQSETVQWK